MQRYTHILHIRRVANASEKQQKRDIEKKNKQVHEKHTSIEK